MDLSHPSGHRINNGIPKDFCSLTYITIDTAIEQIQTLDRGTLLAKIDIKSAFHLLPVNPEDCHLLAMKWRKQLYVDTCLPVGLHSAPKLLNILADLHWSTWEYHQSCIISMTFLHWAHRASSHALIIYRSSREYVIIQASH